MAEKKLRKIKFPGLSNFYIVRKYDDLVDVVKVTGQNTTMAEIATTLASAKQAGDCVIFDISALEAGMRLCSIHIDTTAGLYRVNDLTTGFVRSGDYNGTDKLADIVSTGTQQHTLFFDDEGFACVD